MTWDSRDTWDSGTAFDYPSGAPVDVSDFTARLYSRLPACYRDDDVTAPGQGAGSTAYQYPLLRWLACLCDQAGTIEDTIESFAPPTSSALTDPSQANPAWLPWLGQLVGVDLTLPLTDVASARSDIENAIAVPKGSKQATVNAVAPNLTGTQTVTVTDHYSGDAWEIQVGTLTAETPASLPGQQGFVWGVSKWGTSNAVWANPDPIVWFLENQGLEPVGFQFVHTTS